MNTKLAQEITAMAETDQTMRQRASQDQQWNGEIDRQNTSELKRIVSEFGWPTISLVGEKASQSAWLLVQHADHDLEFQKSVLVLMEKAYSSDKGDINPKNIAYLTDRVLVAEGKKQIYGTQFYKNESGKMVPRPIENEAELDRRRKEMWLGPFEEYKRMMGNQ